MLIWDGVRDKSDALVYLNYTGIVDITEGVAKILGGATDAKTTDFGDSCEWRVFLGLIPYISMIWVYKAELR